MDVRTVGVMLSMLALTGCATQGMGENYRPMIDLNRANAAEYESDLRACQQYAATQMSAGQAAVGGALVGALLGFAITRALGGSGSDGAFGAKVGALSAAGGAAQGAETNQRDIIRRCLAGRGHSVLN